MKKKKILSILLCCFCIFGFSKVSASTDINNLTFNITATGLGTAGSTLEFKVNGDLDYNNYDYAIYLTSDKDSKPTLPSSRAKLTTNIVNPGESWVSAYRSISSDGKVHVSDEWYMLEGYNYAYVVQCDDSSCIMSSNAYELTKPELPKLTGRYSFAYYESDQSMGSITYFPSLYLDNSVGDYKRTVKIGLIEDSDLLKSLSKGESGSLNNLLSYAKSQKGKEYDFVDEIKKNVTDLDLIDGRYYFVYTTYKDSVYRNLEDVTVVYVEPSEFGQFVLSLGSDDFIWDLPDDVNTNTNNTVEEVVENPKTGAVIGISIFGVIVIALLVFKKKNKFSKI